MCVCVCVCVSQHQCNHIVRIHSEALYHTAQRNTCTAHTRAIRRRLFCGGYNEEQRDAHSPESWHAKELAQHRVLPRRRRLISQRSGPRAELAEELVELLLT